MMSRLCNIKFHESRRRLVQHLCIEAAHKWWTPKNLRLLTFLPSLHHIQGLSWPLPLNLDKAMKNSDRIRLQSLDVWLPPPGGPVVELANIDYPRLSTYIDLTAFKTLSIDGGDLLVLHCLDQGTLADMVNLQHLRIDVGFSDTSPSEILACAARVG